MIHIDKLQISMPASLGSRAERIVHLCRQNLADLQLAGTLNLSHLKLAPIELVPNESDASIARRMAHQFESAIKEQAENV